METMKQACESLSTHGPSHTHTYTKINKQTNKKQTNNRNLDQHILHLWSKFGDPSLNGDDESYGTDKLKMGKIFTFNLNFTLKVIVDCRPPPPPPPKKKKVFCICGPNLVILAWTILELSRTSDWCTHTHTDTRTGASNNTQRPKLVLG